MDQHDGKDFDLHEYERWITADGADWLDDIRRRAQIWEHDLRGETDVRALVTSAAALIEELRNLRNTCPSPPKSSIGPIPLFLQTIEELHAAISNQSAEHQLPLARELVRRARQTEKPPRQR